MCCAAKQYSNATYSRLDGTLKSHVYTHSYTHYINTIQSKFFYVINVINKDGIQSKTDLRRLNNIHITANYGALLKRHASWK